MKEREQYRFFDTSDLKPTEGIKTRAKEDFLKKELRKRFPLETIENVHVTYYNSGEYGKCPNLLERIWGSQTKISGLPPFYEIMLQIRTGQVVEELIVWSPIAWNDRFAGTAGGGTSTGGREYLTMPDNCSRGWTVPYAVVNGFTAATIDAKNNRGIKDLISKPDGSLDKELYENWRIRATHHMTIFGKAVAELLHQRPVRFAYMNGGSGGGRQTMMEVQNYPDDYDGAWAACPAIFWHHFLLGGFWASAVMNEYHHFLPQKKNRFFVEEVHRAYGGAKAFYALTKRPVFDARTLIGRHSPGGVITEKDAVVMNEIWRGPHRQDGSRLWYTQYPGCQNWQSIIPIGTYYYPLLHPHSVRPFILAVYYARWITGEPKASFRNINFAALEKLYDDGAKKFADCFGNNSNLDAFIAHGGKLLLDHGTDDPLIPVDGTICYFHSLLERYGKAKTDTFCRAYITPGDNHGNCWGNGAGLTQTSGIKALMDWVENGILPGALRKVRIDRKSGDVIEEGLQTPYEGDLCHT